MTYDAYEKSVDSGRPIELYQFSNGGNIWLYTSSDVDYVVGTVTYNTENIRRTKIVQSQEGIRNMLTLDVRRDLPVAELYIQQIPLYDTDLEVSRLHRDDPDEETKIIWTGRIYEVKWPAGKAQAKIMCDPTVGAQKAESMRGRWQIRCNHTIYDIRCSLNFDAWKTDYTVVAISDDKLVLTLNGISSPSADYYIGGLLKFGTDQFNMIVDQDGDDITVWRYQEDLSVGSTVQIAPGCRNLKDKCIDIFSNFDNYLGAPDVPLKDIFTGDGLKGTV